MVWNVLMGYGWISWLRLLWDMGNAMGLVIIICWDIDGYQVESDVY